MRPVTPHCFVDPLQATKETVTAVEDLARSYLQVWIQLMREEYGNSGASRGTPRAAAFFTPPPGKPQRESPAGTLGGSGGDPAARREADTTACFTDPHGWQVCSSHDAAGPVPSTDGLQFAGVKIRLRDTREGTSAQVSDLLSVDHR